MPLTKPAVTELTVEGATLDLISEFLAQFFDGSAHDVGLTLAVPFPKATLAFQQSAQPQTGAVLGITVVWNTPSGVVKAWENLKVGGVFKRQEIVYAKVMLNFWVRSELTANAAGNAAKQCRDAAQLLAGLLGNSAATRVLNQKGIHRLRPGLPQAVSDTGYALRLVTCRATLRYAVQSQVQAQP